MCLLVMLVAGVRTATRLAVPITYTANADAAEGAKRHRKIEETLPRCISPYWRSLTSSTKEPLTWVNASFRLSARAQK